MNTVSYLTLALLFHYCHNPFSPQSESCQLQLPNDHCNETLDFRMFIEAGNVLHPLNFPIAQDHTFSPLNKSF